MMRVFFNIDYLCLRVLSGWLQVNVGFQSIKDINGHMVMLLSFSDRRNSKRQSAKRRYKILKKVSNNVMV